MLKHPEYKGFIYIFIFFLSFYILLSDGHFDSVDELQVFQTTQSLVTKGNMTILPIGGAIQGPDGNYYSQKGILPSILLIPFYLAGSLLKAVLSQRIQTIFNNPLYAGDYNSMFGGGIIIYIATLFNCFITALLCALYYLFSLKMKFSKKTSFLTAFILGTSTILCYYSNNIFTHNLGSLFLFAAAYCLVIFKDNLDGHKLILAGVFLGLSILTRFELTFAVPIFFWYIIVSAKGSFKFKDLNMNDLTKYRSLLIPILFAVAVRYYINYVKFGIFTFTGYSDMADFNGYLLEGLYGNLISVGRSIFIYSPPVIAALFCFKRFFKNYRNEAVLFFAISLLYALYYSKLAVWYGGMCWGNRYLITLVPFLLFPLNYLAEDYFKYRIKGPFYFMLFFVFVGIVIQVTGMAPNFSYVSLKYSLEGIDINGIYSYMYVPERSQLALHLKTMLNGEFVNYWFFNLYKKAGFMVMMAIAALPLCGIALSSRGIFRMLNEPEQTAPDRPAAQDQL